MEFYLAAGGFSFWRDARGYCGFAGESADFDGFCHFRGGGEGKGLARGDAFVRANASSALNGK